MSSRRFESVEALLAANGLAGLAEEPFPNDGWSGASLTAFRRDRMRYVLKRDSWDRDWIVRATNDATFREARIAAHPPVGAALELPYLGVAPDDTNGVAILMPDLSEVLFDGERPIDEETLDRLLSALARFHVAGWSSPDSGPDAFPAHDPCPLDLRLLLLSPTAARRYEAEGLAVGRSFSDGWAAFRRCAPSEASALIDALSADVTALVGALAVLPSTMLHGDLKLANAGFMPSGSLAVVDWQMTLTAPVALELGWLLVSNSASLPVPPDVAWQRYVTQLAALDGGPELLGDLKRQSDLAWIVGLLLRGWRKGLEAEAGALLASGVSAADDLDWWCDRALAAAGRWLSM